jgi:hypothetical protein
LFVQRQWGRHAWSQYRDNSQSASDTQNQWNSPPEDKFRDEQLANLKNARAKTPTLEKAVQTAKDAEDAANKDADTAEAAAKSACDKAAAAKKAYDDCIGVASAAAGAAAAGEGAGSAAGATGGVGGAVAGGATAAGKAAGGNCEPQRQAYEAAKKACDDATRMSETAEKEANAADDAFEDAEDSLEQLCDEYPPLCRDDWIEESGQPDTRVTTRDLYLNDVWAEQVWLDHQNGDISAQEVSERWSQDPPPEFSRDELQKIEDARPLKAPREQAVKDAKTKADAKRADADKARATADEACAKADAARKAWETCQSG